MAIAAAAVGGLALLTVTSAPGAVAAPGAVPPPGSTYSLALRLPAPARGSGHLAAQSGAGCEQKLERARRQPHDRPVLAIVGASFTAGVGPGNADKSWAVVLTQRLHWDAVIYGDPGAGYVRAGADRKGPVAAEIARLDLRALAPALVIVQAGHDDIGVPLGLERRRVEQAVAMIHTEAPHAQIALLTVFAGRSRSAAAYRTDRAIVAAGRAADGNVIIMDPLAAGWRFPRSHDGLHPTALGDEGIADTVAGILREHGVRPAPTPQPGATSPPGKATPPGKAGAIICDWSIPAPPPR